MANDKDIVRVVSEVLADDIQYFKEHANGAMQILYKMSIMPEAYKRACFRYSVNSFASGYLSSILSEISKRQDATFAESLVRFHEHQQRTLGELGDGSQLAVGQIIVAERLRRYIERFFTA